MDSFEVGMSDFTRWKGRSPMSDAKGINTKGIETKGNNGIGAGKGGATTGKFAPEPESVDLAQLFRETYDQLLKVEPERKVFLELQELPVVEGDREALRRMAFQVLAKSIKLTRSKKIGFIKVSCTEKNEEFVITVKDNGTNPMADLFQNMAS